MPPANNGEMSTAPAPKYGPSAVRDIHYVTGAKSPYVTVKQRKNGQYVVVERLPVHHRARNHGLPTLKQSLAESEVKLNSIKPDWMPTPQAKQLGRHDYRSAPALPPIDLGWNQKAEAVVGSLVNVEHEPGGGNKAIPRQKVNWEARAKIGSLDNINYKSDRPPHTSQSDPLSRRRSSTKLQPTPRYGALAESGALGPALHYTPGGAEVITRSSRYEHVKPRVGSLDNAAHVPGGGDVTVKHHRQNWKSRARIGSLDNVHHVPGGGEVSITNQRLTWQAKPRVGSLDNISHVPHFEKINIPRQKLSWKGRSRIGSLENIHHQPGGGIVQITNNRLRWKSQAKVDTRPPKRHDMSHGSSLDSLDSLFMTQVSFAFFLVMTQIETQKLEFRETAKPKTDTGKA
ncbi:hypothetical protein BaRGS_00031773 [Batillaria attramentaria]|uniref:Microtubule-associated protein n=1 Tax=Batillaria attramentaria TaxID=370345 RepID=A0ABD0JQ64_9CAEN